MAGAYLTVDTTELNEAAKKLSEAISEEGFEKLMKRTLNEVGKKSKTVIYNAAKTEYTFKSAAWFKASIQGARIGGGGYDMECVIPLSGARGAAGKVFAYGGQTSKGHIRLGDRRKAWIMDVNGTHSVLPYHMSSYGGQPPFKNGMPIMTRAGKARLPIQKVVGLAMPQMPLNRAENETSDQLLEYAMQRLIHNFNYMFT